MLLYISVHLFGRSLQHAEERTTAAIPPTDHFVRRTSWLTTFFTRTIEFPTMMITQVLQGFSPRPRGIPYKRRMSCAPQHLRVVLTLTLAACQD